MNDIENPPLQNEINDIVNEQISLIEHEDIDEQFTTKMNNNLQLIRDEFQKNAPKSLNSYRL